MSKITNKVKFSSWLTKVISSTIMNECYIRFSDNEAILIELKIHLKLYMVVVNIIFIQSEVRIDSTGNEGERFTFECHK